MKFLYVNLLADDIKHLQSWGRLAVWRKNYKISLFERCYTQVCKGAELVGIQQANLRFSS